MIGVFVSFTLSQAGMVVHHWRRRERGWARRLSINAVGATATTVVTIIILVSKFTEGAWIPTVAIPALVLLFSAIKRHYDRINRALQYEPGTPLPDLVHSVVVLVGSQIHAGVAEALSYGRSLQPRYLHAVHVADDEEEANRMRELWRSYQFNIPLDVVPSPYRELTRPVLAYIDKLDERYSNDVVTVIIPEFVVQHWWNQLLHNQSALLLKARLLFRKGTVVTSIPVRVG
jgi:hypothetical protein